MPTRELADRCDRTLDRAHDDGASTRSFERQQRAWLDRLLGAHRRRAPRAARPAAGHPLEPLPARPGHRAHRRPRHRGQGRQRARATAATTSGTPRSTSCPFLTYTSPIVARNALRFRHGMLDAHACGPQSSTSGAPSSRGARSTASNRRAYYAAGTAQYHIDADISHALMPVRRRHGRRGLPRTAAPSTSSSRPHACGPTWASGAPTATTSSTSTASPGPTSTRPSSTTTSTPTSWRGSNLRSAAAAVTRIREEDPQAYDRMVARRLVRRGRDRRVVAGRRGDAHPLRRQPRHPPARRRSSSRRSSGISTHTPPEKRPLLLHFHPLVIYRFQVLKQADVVLALLLQGDEFTPAEKRADFDVLRPAHHGRLDALGRRAVDHRGRGRATTSLALQLLHLRPVRRPRRPAQQHGRRRARRLHRRRVERPGVRLRRLPRPRRPTSRSTRACPRTGRVSPIASPCAARASASTSVRATSSSRSRRATGPRSSCAARASPCRPASPC